LFLLSWTDTNTCAKDKYNDSTKQYDQTTQINGVTVSTLSTTDGYAQGWGSAVECAAEDCGSMGAHST
jgi:hypothetical protein